MPIKIKPVLLPVAGILKKLQNSCSSKITWFAPNESRVTGLQAAISRSAPMVALAAHLPVSTNASIPNKNGN